MLKNFMESFTVRPLTPEAFADQTKSLLIERNVWWQNETFTHQTKRLMTEPFVC